MCIASLQTLIDPHHIFLQKMEFYNDLSGLIATDRKDKKKKGYL